MHAMLIELDLVVAMLPLIVVIFVAIVMILILILSRQQPQSKVLKRAELPKEQPRPLIVMRIRHLFFTN
jgi:hypothetical protein